MATNGSKARVYANGYDLSGAFRKAEDEASVEALDSTTFASNGWKEFTAGLREGKISAEGLWRADRVNADQVADVLEAALADGANQDIPVLLFPEGAAVGKSGSGIISEETSYKTTNPVEGLIEVGTEFMSNVGIEAVVSLHDLATEVGTANGTAVDNGALTSNGGAAYLIVTDVAGAAPSVTAKVQHSVDGVTWADLATFTAVTADHRAQRVAVADGTTVNRRLRAVWTFGGTTTGFTFVAAFARK